VQTERAQRLGLTRTLEPHLLVLACTRRAHQGGDREATRSAPLQPRETPPDLVVEWTLHMTRDDGVPSVQY
jgi:hypothetical protein